MNRYAILAALLIAIFAPQQVLAQTSPQAHAILRDLAFSRQEWM